MAAAASTNGSEKVDDLDVDGMEGPGTGSDEGRGSSSMSVLPR